MKLIRPVPINQTRRSEPGQSVPIPKGKTTFCNKPPYLSIDLYAVRYLSSELRFVSNKNMSKGSEQSMYLKW
jgi:hypothetical protein